MNIQLVRALVLVAMFALPAHFTSPASAQSELAKKAMAKAKAVAARIESACAKDLKSYCSTVTPGEGRLALCIMAHENKISDACFGAVFDAAEDIELAVNKISRAVEACASDMDKVCGDVEEGEGRIAQCLVNNKPKLTPACQAEMAAIEKRLGN